MGARGARLTNRSSSWSRFPAAAGLALLAVLALNANGREIGSFDTQPTKFAAWELAVRGTLTLDRVVERTPELGRRPGFARTSDGHYRSAYPVLPSILAAGPAWALIRMGLVDPDAPVGPTVVAKLTSSLVMTGAIVCAFLVARQRTSAGNAVLVAVGYGLGTNAWLAGQTLGGHETVAFGLMTALVVLARPGTAAAGLPAWIAAAMLAVAGAARPQVAPSVAVLTLYLLVRNPRLRQLWPVSLVAVGAGLVVAFNIAWFGHPFGAVPHLESLHPAVHATSGTFTNPWPGALGLLVSPSRGLLVFSPVLLVCLAGLGAAFREGWRGPLAWCLVAAAAQFGFYASYTVWWGGHSYGPRYALDALPPLVPLAAAGVEAIKRVRFARMAAVAALAWSICLAATGAFSYPAELWNADPSDVDRNHARLWEWRDPQFVRCWRTGLSPQNFALFRPDARHGPGD
jgi:hypothetical protein